ncbi:MAG: DUF3857 domain-containing transglutaminase family protein [Salegentibacter sp.]
MRYLLSLILCFGYLPTLYCQNENYPATSIDEELAANAYAVIRENSVEIEVADIDQLLIKKKLVVTVLNEKGDDYVAAYDFYDENSEIKHQRAYIYDKNGEEIEKIKQKDFRDQSRVGSSELYSDDRVSYLVYTPRSYPYTVVYESEVEKESTLLLPPLYPFWSYNVSAENCSYKLVNPQHYPIRFKEKNMDSLEVVRHNSEFELAYTIKNIPAFKKEPLSPSLAELLPKVEVSLDHFSLMGVEGQAANWKEFGKWQYEHLLQGRQELPTATVQKVAALTAAAKTDREKAKIIYHYMQENTRYISVQLGIGGWKPMEASEVDRLGYGDCKALVNYTRALLQSQNIASNYAIVYSGKDQKGIDPEFSSLQGDHVILNIPQADEDIWLECTSQTMPFNFLGDFTDNRDVLLVKPDGGEIVKTPEYAAADNLKQTNCSISLSDDGSYTAEMERKSKGVPYDRIYPLMRQKEDVRTMYYKENWGHLHDLKILKMDFENDRDNKVFTEKLQLEGQKLASKAGKRLLLSLNFLLPDIYHLQRDGDRKRSFQISRGQTREESFIYQLPQGFEVEALPESFAAESEFGKFSIEIEKKEREGSNVIEVKRHYVLNAGTWPAEKYQDFRKFMDQINMKCNRKAVIVVNQPNLK